MDFLAKPGQGSDLAEGNEFRLLSIRAPFDKVFDSSKRTHLPLADDRFGGSLAQATDVAKADSQAGSRFALPVSITVKGTTPFRVPCIDGFHSQAVALRVFHEGGRTIESHGLIIQHG